MNLNIFINNFTLNSKEYAYFFSIYGILELVRTWILTDAIQTFYIYIYNNVILMNVYDIYMWDRAHYNLIFYTLNRYLRHHNTDEIFPKSQSRIRRSRGKNSVQKRRHFVIMHPSYINNVLDHFFIFTQFFVNVTVLNRTFDTKIWVIFKQKLMWKRLRSSINSN